MKKIERDDEREERIWNEAIVDAHDEEERSLGWYYYLADKISFPFPAKCTAIISTSPLDIGNEIEVIGMADENVCRHEMLVTFSSDSQNRNIDVPLRQLKPEIANEATEEAIDDWKYWFNRGYEF